MLKTLKDLALAMLNATLILVIICLFLTWKVVNKADQISANFARSLVTVQPLRDDINGATAELAGLRDDVAQLPEQLVGQQLVVLRRIEARLDQMESQIGEARQSVKELSQAPAKLIDYAIDTAADKLAQGVKEMRRCVPPNS